MPIVIIKRILGLIEIEASRREGGGRQEKVLYPNAPIIGIIVIVIKLTSTLIGGSHMDTRKSTFTTPVQQLLEYIEGEGVRHIFGIPGGPLMP